MMTTTSYHAASPSRPSTSRPRGGGVVSEDVHEQRHGEGEAAGHETGEAWVSSSPAGAERHDQAGEDPDEHGDGQASADGGHVRRLPPRESRRLDAGWGCAGGRLGAGSRVCHRWSSRRPPPLTPRALGSPTCPTRPSARRRLTVVYNPVKVDDLDAAKELVAKAAAQHGWEDPSWIETTAEETGEKQGREAVRAGSDVVASLGGDGTVRAVASALVGTDVALGLLPGGTGNLLARNLGLPVDSLEDAVERDARWHRPPHRRRAHARGRQADRAAAEPRHARRRVDRSTTTRRSSSSWPASASTARSWPARTRRSRPPSAGSPTSSAALRQVFSRGFRVDVSSRGGAGVTGESGDHERDHDEPSGSVSRHARTVVVGNCGTLQGGIELMPEAKVDDGILDAVVVAPKGALGWLSVISDVVTRHRAGHRRLDRLRGREFTVDRRSPRRGGDRRRPDRRAPCRWASAVLPESLVVRVG